MKRTLQPRIDVALKASTTEAYLKMIRTAYELALSPTMPLKQFKLLIKCQRENGVVLIEGRGHRNETNAKISGFLAKFKSYEFLCKMASYLNILDASGPASLVFEGDGLMPYEIEATIERTCFELEELAENAGTDEELLSSYINMLY